MRRLMTTAAITLICTALICPTIDARGRNNSNNGQRSEQRQRPSGSGYGTGNSRPGNRHEYNRPGNNGNRPNTPNHGDINRPDNNRPGNQHGNYRPGNMGHRPSTPNRPNHNTSPSRPQHPQWNYGNHHRPGNGHNHFNPGPPPPRPLMPVHHHWHRPAPPHHYRPVPGWRPFTSILGITLGTAINLSVNSLINNGYTVSGYGNDVIYLSDASMLNMIWPYATLFYNNGGLYASEFVYSTPGYDTGRYYRTYNQLTRTYGNPIDVSNVDGVISSTWWGTDNQFISLTFQSGIAANGSTRFFTRLSFGN